MPRTRSRLRPLSPHLVPFWRVKTCQPYAQTNNLQHKHQFSGTNLPFVAKYLQRCFPAASKRVAFFRQRQLPLLSIKSIAREGTGQSSSSISFGEKARGVRECRKSSLLPVLPVQRARARAAAAPLVRPPAVSLRQHLALFNYVNRGHS
jgi:hypothetical protein